MEEVKENKKIASSSLQSSCRTGNRLHEAIQNYEKKGMQEINPLHCIGQIVFVCAHLTNMLPVKMRELFLSMEKLAEGTTDE